MSYPCSVLVWRELIFFVNIFALSALPVLEREFPVGSK